MIYYLAIISMVTLAMSMPVIVVSYLMGGL